MKTCSTDGCDRKHRARGYCGWHYQKAISAGTIRLIDRPKSCYVEGCMRGHKANGLCHFHDNRKRKGMPDWDTRPARNLVQPPGTRKLSGNGYMTVKQDDGYWELEHRAVMAETLGRALLPGENVHHINGDRLDNRPENLELWSDRQPKGQRVEDKIAWAVDILEHRIASQRLRGSRRDDVSKLPSLNHMLRRNLDRHRAVVRQINDEMLGRATLLLSKHPGSSAEGKAKRAEKNAANNGTPRDPCATHSLHIVSSSLNVYGHNVARVELLLVDTATIERLIHHAPVALNLNEASLCGAETVRAVLLLSLHGGYSTRPPPTNKGLPTSSPLILMHPPLGSRGGMVPRPHPSMTHAPATHRP